MNFLNTFWSRTLCLAVIVTFCLSMKGLAQPSPVAVMNFIKATPGQGSDYVAMEKKWKEAVHQKQIDAGKRIGWYFMGKHINGANDEYDFITVDVYPSWDAYSTAWDASVMEANPDLQNTGEMRTIVRSEVVRRATMAKNSKDDAKIMTIAFMKVDQDKHSAYMSLETDIYQPVHEATIEAGQMSSWFVMQRTVPWGQIGDYNYMAINGFSSWSQFDNYAGGGGDDEIWKKVHPNVTGEEVGKKTNEARTMSSMEIWEMIDYVEAPAPDEAGQQD